MNLRFDFPLAKEDNLLRRFEEIHNYIYANDGLSTQQTLEEFVKILFLKIFDESQPDQQFAISADEWNLANQGKSIESFSSRISNLFESTKSAYPGLFDADDKVRLSPITLGFTVNKLQSISLVNSSQDAKGLAFQKFLSHHEKDSRGQFFTPEPVIDFCVEIIQPKPHETIVDPACGSGGFLMSALKYLRKRFPEADPVELVQKKLFGLDINKSIARIAKMKLMLEANGKTNIMCNNSLEDLDLLKLTLGQPQGFDVVLANPPFGTGGKITNHLILSKFDLGYKWTGDGARFFKTKTVSQGQPAEILFVERCLQLLKEGGRMGIVLPNGHFENPSLEYLRYFIKQKAKLLGIVNLPQETFIPYGTGVKTSLLFLEKETANTSGSYPVFFGKVKKLGYQGNKNGTPVYRKNSVGQILKDDNGQPMPDEDFSLVINDFHAFQRQGKIESANSFSIFFNELNGRFDYDFYSPENRRMMAGFNGNAVRLGDVCEIVKVKSRKLKDPHATVEYVELSDVNTHSFEIINSTAYPVHELPSRASYEIKTGDILTAIAGNSVGTRKHATAWVTEEFDGYICTNGFRVLRNFQVDAFFLLYF